MGLRFRKSLNFGPFRVNFSKSGVGYSVGGKGFRYTKKAGGGTRTTASIPGTGVSYVKDYNDGKKPSGGAPSSPGPSGGKKRPKIWPYVVAAVFALGVVGSAFSGCSGGDGSEPSASISEGSDLSSVSSSVSSAGSASALQPQETEQDQPQDAEPEQPQDAEPEQPQDTEPEQPQDAEPEQPQDAEPEQPQDTEPEQPAETTPPDEEPPAQAETPGQSSGVYVGSIDSDKYHVPGCRFAEKILPENEIWFDSGEDAKNAGYNPCGVCKPTG